MKCDLCSAQGAAQYAVEYGWVQLKVITHSSREKVAERTYRPIGVLSRNVCSKCARGCLRKYERWRRLGCWLGSSISVLLFLLTWWIQDQSWGPWGAWGFAWAIPVLLAFFGFLYWSFRSIVMLAFRPIDRDAALKEAIESDIWRSNVDRLREALHKLEPHFIFHPNWDRSSRNIHGQLGLWHYCESGGPIFEYFVRPRVPIPGTNWIQ